MFDHCLYFNATALARRVEREWADAFSPFGLTPAQAFMLRVVLARPGLLHGELATALALSRPTVTRALNTLEEQGFVMRQTSAKTDKNVQDKAGRDKAGDGREQQILPTPQAYTISQGLNEAGAAMTRKLKARMGDKAFLQAVDTLRESRFMLD